MAGSAFQVSGNGKTWLVTCVHNVTNMNKTPVSAFDPQSSIQVLGTSVAIVGLGSRNLGLLRLNDTSILVDCISIQLDQGEISALAAFGAYDLTDIVPPVLNGKVKFSGFPGMSTQPIAASVTRGSISQIEGISIVLDSPATPGFSGGPLYTDEGLLGIVRGDLGISPNFSNAVAISLDVVREFIFP